MDTSQPNPAANATPESNKSGYSADVKVSGVTTSIQSDTKKPPDHCEITCKTEKNWWDKFKPFVECTGLILLAVYTGCTIRIFYANRDSADIAKKTYAAQERPYVGVDSVGVLYGSLDAKGKLTTNNSYFADATQLEIHADIKNFGPVPGTNFNSEWAFFIDDQRWDATKLPEFGKIIFPNQAVRLMGGITGALFQKVVRDQAKVEIEVRISYDGPSEHYDYCTLRRFLAPPGQFMDLGKCTHKW